jgi:hypothetical protein
LLVIGRISRLCRHSTVVRKMRFRHGQVAVEAAQVQ